jgi:hypothetical protein
MVLGSAISDVKLRRIHTGAVNLRKVIKEFILNAMASSEKVREIVQTSMVENLNLTVLDKFLKKSIAKKHKNAILEQLKDSDIHSKWDIYNAITYVASNTKISKSAEEKLQIQAQRVLSLPVESAVA